MKFVSIFLNILLTISQTVTSSRAAMPTDTITKINRYGILHSGDVPNNLYTK